MKSVSVGLAAHLLQSTTTLAMLVKISRVDGTIMGFTGHDQDISWDGVTYAANGSFAASAIENTNALSTDNLDITGVLSSDAISDADIAAGRYDQARIDVYLCNWQDLSQGTIQLRRGWLGELTRKGSAYQAEVRGLHDLLQRPVGDVFSPECRHKLGDSKCTVNLASYTVTGSAAGASDRRTFGDLSRGEPDGTFNGGLVTWTSGQNAGLSMEIKSFYGGIFELWLPMPYDITGGDGYSIYAGCDKRFDTCRNTFNNLVNFGGFPYLPGLDRMLNYPDG